MNVELQLCCEVNSFVCTFECNVALHVDMTTFGNDTCEISPESAEDVSEDQEDVTKEYRKPRTKVRKMLTVLTSDPPVKASPGHIPLF
jgi:hypothetical protein